MASTSDIPYHLASARELCTLGAQLLQAGRAKGALVQFEKALALAPDMGEALLGRGVCLHELGSFTEALETYARLLAADPGQAVVWNNRGNTLLELCRYREAADSYRQALQLVPGLHDARVAMASCLQSLGHLDEAMAACDAVLAADPGHAEAHWNKSLLLLLRGDYSNGWREYEWRWRKRNFTSPRRDFPQPRWQGEPASGKTILIHAEQGFGDTIQFCRYIPMVAAQGLRVLFECQPPLAELMRTLTGVSQVIPMGAPLPEFDLQIPLMSLPLVFGTTLETIPAATPYLTPPADRLALWRELVMNDGRLKVGLCWAGKAYPDPNRSCPAEALAPLADLRGVSWYSLQLGWQAPLPFQMADLTGSIRDFADSAALISRLDLVISIDTAAAHLAGAIGKNAIVMLPHVPDWRWLLKRGDSPWYPLFRILRPKERGSWPGIVQKLCDAASQFSERRHQDE